MPTKLPSKSKRIVAATRAIEYRAVGKSWAEIDDLVKQEHPECWNTAVLDAIYRLAHLDVQDWLPRSTKIPDLVQRYWDARYDWEDEIGTPYQQDLKKRAAAYRKENGLHDPGPEMREWYKEAKKEAPVFVPPDSSMVKNYRDLS